MFNRGNDLKYRGYRPFHRGYSVGYTHSPRVAHITCEPGHNRKLTKINKNSHFLVIFWSLIGEMTQNSVGIGPHTVGMAWLYTHSLGQAHSHTKAGQNEN